jgi:hypothetical protein
MHNLISGNISSTLSTIAITAALGACTSETIRTDYDPAVNFGHYRTYDFVPGAGTDDGKYQNEYSKRLAEAISIEMEKRGYVRSSDPDLLIRFDATARQESRLIFRRPQLVDGYYDFRAGHYHPLLNYGFEGQSYVLRYTEGTFNIDLVDARKKRLVWEAVGHGYVSVRGLEEFDDRVYEGVPRYFKKYPFTAGSGIPRSP